MRILMFGNFYEYQAHLANALSKKNEVMLLLPSRKMPKSIIGLVDEEVKLTLMKTDRSPHDPRAIVTVKNALQSIWRFRPDVAHMQLGGSSIDLVFLPILKRYPLVTTFHDVKLHLGEESSWSEFVRSVVRKSADEIIVHGEFLKNEIMRIYGVREQLVHSVPMGDNGVEKHKGLGYDSGEDEGYALFFGRIHQYKGLEYLIKAEPMISERILNVKIVIAGNGENFGKYQALIGDRSDKFTVVNRRISDDEASQLFRKSAVVVLPYVEASQSAVLLNAYGFGKPVVVTNVGSLPEVVEEGRTGFIVPPRDPKSLASAVAVLLADNRLRKEMGMNGFRKLTTDLSWDSIASKTLMVYEKAIKKGHCSGKI